MSLSASLTCFGRFLGGFLTCLSGLPKVPSRRSRTSARSRWKARELNEERVREAVRRHSNTHAQLSTISGCFFDHSRGTRACFSRGSKGCSSPVSRQQKRASKFNHVRMSTVDGRRLQEMECGDHIASGGRSNAHLECKCHVGEVLRAAANGHEKRAPQMEHVLRRTRLQQHDVGI